MKSVVTSFFTLLSFLAFSQIADFENQIIEKDSFLNGSDLLGGFMSDNIFLKNDYNVDWGSWSGWALSNKTDTLTPGFVNQYSSYGGSGR